MARRSAGRGSGRGKTARQTVKSTFSSITSDIKMGMSTFGQSKSKQAQTLRDAGYSERAITSYQERTAASAARARKNQSTRSEYSGVAAPRAAPRAPSQEELRRARERAEGQARRKKFEKEVGKKVAKRRKLFKLINLGTGD